MRAPKRKAAPKKPVTRIPARKVAPAKPYLQGQAIQRRPEPPTVAEAIEKLLIEGNLAPLTPEHRLEYYNKVCRSLGLNPLTKPFAYIQLNGKTVLYALRDCTDQLRKVHGISVTESKRTVEDGLCVVEVKVCNREGRTDTGTGAVLIDGTKGESRANVIMKAETKAKRRATLSICGLGMLDECELDTMRGNFKMLTPAGRVIDEQSQVSEHEQKYLDREREGIEKLSPEQRAVLEAKMNKVSMEAGASRPGSLSVPPDQAAPSTTAEMPPASKPAPQVKQPAAEQGTAPEGAAVPCLFYKHFPQSGTYQITGADSLLRANRELLKPLWNATAGAVVVTPEQLGKLISQFERTKVPFRELQ